MSNVVTDNDLGWQAFLDGLDGIDRVDVQVGVFADEDPEIAAYALINELGSDKANIPERAAVRSAIDKNTEKYIKRAGELAIEITKGKLTSTAALELLGGEVQDDIKTSIETWTDPPNAKSTEDKKGVNDPLVDSGDYLNAIKVRVD